MYSGYSGARVVVGGNWLLGTVVVVVVSGDSTGASLAHEATAIELAAVKSNTLKPCLIFSFCNLLCCMINATLVKTSVFVKLL